MQTDQDQTSRASKRPRDLDPPQLPPPCPTQSASSEEISDVFDTELHKSGCLSPVKQIQHFEDFEEYPVFFCNFDDDTDEVEPDDVTSMHTAIQRVADGVGFLGYNGIDVVVTGLPRMDRMRS